MSKDYFPGILKMASDDREALALIKAYLSAWYSNNLDMRGDAVRELYDSLSAYLGHDDEL